MLDLNTPLAAKNMNRRAYGFEIKKNFFDDAQNLIKSAVNPNMFSSVEPGRQARQKEMAL